MEANSFVDTGKPMVRSEFIDRLECAGLKRPKACKTAGDFEAMKKRLIDYLAYLTPISISVLADQVLDTAAGADRDQWPSELLIRQMAEALERRPPELAPIVTSWMGSIEGPRSVLAGNAVEMFRHLLSHRRPLLPYDRTQIDRQAADNRRQRQIILDRRRDGIDRDEDRDWLVAYEADLARINQIIESAKLAREARGAGQQ